MIDNWRKYLDNKYSKKQVIEMYLELKKINENIRRNNRILEEKLKAIKEFYEEQ